MTDARRRVLLGAICATFVAACLVNLTMPFVRHQESVVGRYGSYARNFARMGVWATKFGMIQVNAPDMSVFGDWRNHYYPQRPPISAIALAGWVRTFGESEASIRLHLIVLGVASILLFSLVARKLLEEEWAIVATALFALNPMFLYYSLIAVHYCWGLFFSLAAWAAALRGRTLLMFVCVGLGCFTDWPPYFTAFSLMLYYWKGPKSPTTYGIGATAVACFGVNLLHRWWLDPSGRFVTKLLSVGSHHVALQGVSVGAYLYSEAREIGLYYTVGLALAALYGTLILARRRSPILLFALFGLEEVLFFRQAYEHDYLTISLAPFLALAGAVGLRELWTMPKRRPLALALAALAAIQAAVVIGDRLTRRGGNEAAWQVAVAIHEHTAPREKTLVTMDNSLIEYYSDRYVARIDSIAHELSLSPSGPVAVATMDDLVRHLEKGASGFDWVVAGAAERVDDFVPFLKKAGVRGAKLEEFGFFVPEHPLRQLLRRQALSEESWGAFQAYRLQSPR